MSKATITSLDAGTARRMKTKLDEAIKKIAAEEGLHYEPERNLRYSSELFTYKVTFSLALDEKQQQEKVEQVRAEYNALCATCDLKEEWFGETFESRGTAYRITGANLRARKNPVHAERVRDGKIFAFPIFVVTMSMT